MKQLMWRLSLFFLLLAVVASCKPSQELPGFSETKTSEKSDSVHVKETIRYYPVPGATVTQKINLDSLKALFQAGTINRYYTTTDKKGLTELQTRFDLLTGQLQQECATRDSTIVAKDREVYRLQKQVEAWQQITQPAPEKKNWLQELKEEVQDILGFLGFLCLIYLGLRLFRFLFPGRAIL